MDRQEGELPEADGPQIVKGKDKRPPPLEGSKKSPASKRTARDRLGENVFGVNLQQRVSDAEGPDSTKEEDPSSYKVTEPRLDLYDSSDDDDPYRSTVIVANLQQIVSDAEGPNSTKEEDLSSYKATEPHLDLDKSSDDDDLSNCFTRWGLKKVPYEVEGDEYPEKNVCVRWC